MSDRDDRYHWMVANVLTAITFAIVVLMAMLVDWLT